MRRQQLTEAQITALLDPPTDQRELVRHYTLSAADFATIRRSRGLVVTDVPKVPIWKALSNNGLRHSVRSNLLIL
jgi:hypothetical protein